MSSDMMQGKDIIRGAKKGEKFTRNITCKQALKNINEQFKGGIDPEGWYYHRAKGKFSKWNKKRDLKHKSTPLVNNLPPSKMHKADGKQNLVRPRINQSSGKQKRPRFYY